jgi:hypothetical protein
MDIAGGAEGDEEDVSGRDGGSLAHGGRILGWRRGRKGGGMRLYPLPFSCRYTYHLTSNGYAPFP